MCWQQHPVCSGDTAASSLSTSLHLPFEAARVKCIFERRRLKLVAFGLLLYSLSFLIRFLHPSLSSLSLPPLSLFPSSTPFIRAALVCRYMNTTMECVCVWERDEMGMYNVRQMTQHLRTGHTHTHSFSHISDTCTHVVIATQFHLEE